MAAPAGAAVQRDWLFPSRSHPGDHLTTRQYGRLVDEWVALIGLDPAGYGTHSLPRTKVALIYKRTGNVRACQLLRGRHGRRILFVSYRWRTVIGLMPASGRPLEVIPVAAGRLIHVAFRRLGCATRANRALAPLI